MEYWERVFDVPTHSKIEWIFDNFVNASIDDCTEEFIKSSSNIQKKMLDDEAKDDPRYKEWATKLDEYFECALDYWRREQCDDETKMLWDALDVCEKKGLVVQNGNLFQKVCGHETANLYADGKEWVQQFDNPQLIYKHLCKQTGGFQAYHANLNNIEVSNGTLIINDGGTKFVDMPVPSRIYSPHPYYVANDTPIFDEWVNNEFGPIVQYVIGKVSLHPLQRDMVWYTPIFVSDSLFSFIKELWGYWFSSFNFSGITTDPVWTKSTGGGIMLTRKPLETTGAVLDLQHIDVPDFGSELPNVIQQCVQFYLDNIDKPPQLLAPKKSNLNHGVDVVVEMLACRWNFDIDDSNISHDGFKAHVKRFVNDLGIECPDLHVSHSTLKRVFRELGFPCAVKKSGISHFSVRLEE